MEELIPWTGGTHSIIASYTADAVAEGIRRRLAAFVTDEYTILSGYTSEDEMVEAIQDTQTSDDPSFGCFIGGSGEHMSTSVCVLNLNCSYCTVKDKLKQYHSLLTVCNVADVST